MTNDIGLEGGEAVFVPNQSRLALKCSEILEIAKIQHPCSYSVLGSQTGLF